jgi:hypothetical protein
LTGNEISTTGITFAALFASVFVAKKISSIGKYDIREDTKGSSAYFASRTIKKDFTFQELKKSVMKSFTPEAYAALPDLPATLSTLPLLFGDKKTIKEMYQSSPTSKVTLTLNFNP